MTTVYLIRHAQAQGNVDRVFQGHYDGKISPFGYKQLVALGADCRKYNFDCIYSSPLSRAQETAAAVNSSYGYEIKICDGLIEINGGDWEGLPWDSFADRDSVQNTNWLYNLAAFCAPNGESMAHANERIKNAVLDIVKENEGKTICIVSHGCVLSCFFNFCMGREFKDLTKDTLCDNTAVSKVLFDENLKPMLEFMGNNHHLPEELKSSVRKLWTRKEKD